MIGQALTLLQIIPHPLKIDKKKNNELYYKKDLSISTFDNLSMKKLLHFTI